MHVKTCPISRQHFHRESQITWFLAEHVNSRNTFLNTVTLYMNLQTIMLPSPNLLFLITTDCDLYLRQYHHQMYETSHGVSEGVDTIMFCQNCTRRVEQWVYEKFRIKVNFLKICFSEKLAVCFCSQFEDAWILNVIFVFFPSSSGLLFPYLYSDLYTSDEADLVRFV